MKIIHRYIIREFIEAFIFGITVFSCILLLDQVFQLINLFLSKGISAWIVVRLFLLILPNIFSLTIPMAVLFGILLAYGRFSEDNEITAFKSSGVKYQSFTMPVVFAVLLICGFLAYFNQDLSPSTHQRFRKLYQEILNKSPLVKFDEKTVTTMGEYRLYVEEADKKNNTLKGINIYKFSNDPNDSPWRISASSGDVSVTQSAVVFNLFNGTWQKTNPSEISKLINLNFTKYRFAISLDKNIMPFSQSFREMTGKQLREEIISYKKRQMPVNLLENEYWFRWTLALAPLAFAVIGIPLGIISEKGGRSIGFGISLIVLFGYYLLLITGLNVGEKGYVHPSLILWLPNLVAFTAGFFFWKRMLKK